MSPDNPNHITPPDSDIKHRVWSHVCHLPIHSNQKYRMKEGLRRCLNWEDMPLGFVPTHVTFSEALSYVQMYLQIKKHILCDLRNPRIILCGKDRLGRILQTPVFEICSTPDLVWSQLSLD